MSHYCRKLLGVVIIAQVGEMLVEAFPADCVQTKNGVLQGVTDEKTGIREIQGDSVWGAAGGSVAVAGAAGGGELGGSAQGG